jgi:hypothetical protein
MLPSCVRRCVPTFAGFGVFSSEANSLISFGAAALGLSLYSPKALFDPLFK